MGPHSNANKAVFFDRDDTLIKDIPYNGDADLVELLPNAKKACRLLKEHGFLLFIVTNQSGVGRGFISKAQVNAVNRRVIDLIGAQLFSGVYCCYDDPNDPQQYCRKPSPSMIFKARDDYGLNLAASYTVGDKLSDIQSGFNAGCKTVFLESRSDPNERLAAHELADFSTTDLLHAAQWICDI